MGSGVSKPARSYTDILEIESPHAHTASLSAVGSTRAGNRTITICITTGTSLPRACITSTRLWGVIPDESQVITHGVSQGVMGTTCSRDVLLIYSTPALSNLRAHGYHELQEGVRSVQGYAGRCPCPVTIAHRLEPILCFSLPSYNEFCRTSAIVSHCRSHHGDPSRIWVDVCIRSIHAASPLLL